MTAKDHAVQDTKVMCTNTYWTLVYAFISIDMMNPAIRDIDFEGIAFDIAVSGGIVFG